MEKLEQKDVSKYLQFGVLTTPFLPDDYILEKVMIDYNYKLSQNIHITKLESLYNWIACKVKIGDKEFCEKFKFQRNAKEIWESGFATGCTDYALLFATFARQIKIPTTCLHTAEKGWLIKLSANQDFNHHFGHTFCECFYDGKWILVDPTCRKITPDYDCNNIELPYKVGPSNNYIAYFRGLDLGKKQTIKQHNDLMDKYCSKIQSA